MPESDGMFAPPVTTGTGGSSATTTWNVPLSTVVCSRSDLAQMAAKIDLLKKWTVSTYKTTKQSICENLGKAERTVDKELEGKIESLKDLHRRYNQVLNMSRSFANYLHSLHDTQRSLAESLYQLSLKETALSKDCAGSSECHRSLAHNGELLERSLNFFLSSLQTVCDKTFEDTLFTIHSHDQARLEYDVHLHELNTLRAQPNVSPEAIAEAEQKYNLRKEHYEQLKADVKVKMQLLEENRIKVMQKQLFLLQNALLAYFSGNAKDLQAKLEEFDLQKVATNNCAAPSFLEH
uniref:AH domain-containing protein n=1 Tax=Syphacia muris TaxID=451379 RepID=A0A0N5ALY3_9BILA